MHRVRTSRNDPMPVAAEIVTTLQVFATRRIDTFDPVVITVTKIRAGTTNNVIPETVLMQGTLRSVSERSRRKALEGIDRVTRNIAAAHEMEATFTHEEGYPVTVNDPRSCGSPRESRSGSSATRPTSRCPRP